MKIFIDTAEVSELKLLAETGLVDGVTTNPSLIAKSGRKIADAIAEICALQEMVKLTKCTSIPQYDFQSSL